MVVALYCLGVGKGDGRQDACSILSENIGGGFAFISQDAAQGAHLDFPTLQYSETLGQLDLSVAAAEKSESSVVTIN